MGLNDHATDDKRKKGSSRGSVNNKARLAAFARSDKAAKGDWGGCDPAWIQAVVIAITRLGGAVTFGLSRDGGAHSVTLMLEGERQTLWFNGDADLDVELSKVYETLNAMTP